MVHIIDLHFQNHSQTIAAFIIESAQGPVLVETGPHSTLAVLETGIRLLGYSPEEVRHVFLTHIHLDHAGAAWEFANRGATVYLHPLGAPHFQNPEKLLHSARRIYGDQMESLWGELKPVAPERLKTVEHLQMIKVGDLKLQALYTPGHAVHHIAWRLGDVVFTGDVAGIRIAGGIVVPPCPPPDIHIGSWQQSIRLIREKKFKTLYLTHFGAVTQVKAHLQELETRLLNWSNWIKPFVEQGVQQEVVTPLFQNYVAMQLKAGGITGDNLDKYESANPAWMSVAGLMRYWSKNLLGAFDTVKS